jgi:hypothetical protein
VDKSDELHAPHTSRETPLATPVIGAFFYSPTTRKETMFWSFLIVSAIGTGLVRLGAVSVMAAVLSTSLKAALAVIVILAGPILWRRRKDH